MESMSSVPARMTVASSISAKNKVVDNDASHAAIDATGRIPLQKGYHPFALHYFEDYEGEYLGWSWRTPSMSKLDAIPTENLYIN